MLYLASLQPRALSGGENLDPGQLLSTLGTKAVGYVFSSSGIIGELYSSPANRMFLDSGHVGQAFGALTGLSDNVLMELLPRHGFSTDAVHLLRNGDRVGLIRNRLETLIDGERTFMREKNVKLPTERTAATIADSDASDEDE